jgi:hypothetical protein
MSLPHQNKSGHDNAEGRQSVSCGVCWVKRSRATSVLSLRRMIGFTRAWNSVFGLLPVSVSGIAYGCRRFGTLSESLDAIRRRVLTGASAITGRLANCGASNVKRFFCRHGPEARANRSVRRWCEREPEKYCVVEVMVITFLNYRQPVRLFPRCPFSSHLKST